jgi:ThiF family
MSVEPTEALLAGRRALDELAGSVEIVEDWKYFEAVGRWGLLIAASVGADLHWKWYILTDTDYPRGSVAVMPAVKGGIETTYPHQSANHRGDKNLPWRSGKLCLETVDVALSRWTSGTHESRDVHGMLLWSVRRTLEWMEAALSGMLLAPGDPFELPEFTFASQTRLAYSESPADLKDWAAQPHRMGYFEYTHLLPKAGPEQLIVLQFFDSRGQKIRLCRWGSVVKLAAENQANIGRGTWVLLDKMPVVEPWAAPRTWMELRQVLTVLEVNLEDLLERAVQVRGRSSQQLLLVGFPIPEKIGEPPAAVHWQPLVLPKPSRRNRGFGAKGKPGWHRDRPFGTDEPPAWLKSQNWEPAQLGSRGRADDVLIGSRICLIGAGALGGFLAESLVRSGVNELVIFDGDTVEAGNLVRSRYYLHSLGLRKTSALAMDLESANPHATVKRAGTCFPPVLERDAESVRGCSIIIDCTGDDALLNHLESFNFGVEPRLFVSLSLGYGAERLFAYALHSERFDASDYRRRIQPWLDRECAEHPSSEFPREGLGCWHPVFPARVHDIMTMTGIAARCLEEFVAQPVQSGRLVVFTTHRKGGTLLGINRNEEDSEQ